MADTHEEQLLSDLLEAIAREDAALDAPHLEAGVLESALAARTVPSMPSRMWVVLPVAAAVLIALAMTVRLKPDTSDSSARLKPSPTEDIAIRNEEIAVRLKPDTTATARPQAATEVTIARLQPDLGHKRDLRPQPEPPAMTEAANLDSPIEFVPLMPLTEQELTGSFQIVRVQMPSASLGALRSPIAHSNDMVEADVLLGEDGRARAIRLNTNGSIYPWRSR